MEKFLLFISVLLFGLTVLESKALELPAVFGDNMVVQQKTNTPFWGKRVKISK